MLMMRTMDATVRPSAAAALSDRYLVAGPCRVGWRGRGDEKGGEEVGALQRRN
jgi:hypothetical protein